MAMGPAMNPIAKVIDKELASKIIDNTENERIREDDQKRSQRKFVFATTIIVLVFVVVLVLLLQASPDLLKEVLAFLGGLVAGALGGYGAARLRD